jgi:hypothetical protein
VPQNLREEKIMTKKQIWLGMLVLVLAFGLTVVGCGSEDDPSPPPPPGSSASDPVDRSENRELGSMTSQASGWRTLLNSINSNGEYINLDLSACTMTGTSFNPDSTVETGKKYIVSIILPTAATSIETGTYSTPAFKNFTSLKSVTGSNTITIGDYSFYNLSWSPTSVDFPKATTIGQYAFCGTPLETVNFPLVTTIGNSAFSSCEQLKSPNFPVVQTIGIDAFRHCSNLESISFPKSAELGKSSDDGSYSNPFAACFKLTSFNLTGTGSLSVIENGKALVRNSTILLAYPTGTGNISMSDITALDGKVFERNYSIIISNGEPNITGIEFPNVTSIGSSAFSGHINIQTANFPLVTSIGSSAFSYCTRLQTGIFPELTTIESSAFSNCSNLATLSIPKVTNIGTLVFQDSGNTSLTITMGNSAPALSTFIVRSGSVLTKTVKVKIPTGATGYTPAASPFTGTSVTVSGSSTASNWANGFRGAGWDGYAFINTNPTQAINQNITLTIEQQ